VKRLLFGLFAAGLLNLAHATNTPTMATKAIPAKPPVGTFQLDPAHSKVGFEISHMVISTVDGHFNTFEGTIDMADRVEKSKFNATIDVASIDTGVKKRDDHLRADEFFGVEKFPKMTFQSTDIKGTPENMKISGNLTIKGVTKKINLDGKFLGAIDDGWGNDRAAFSAKGKISRKDFGLTWSKMVEAGPVVGDEVTLDLRAEAIRPKTATAKK
jgi:polyisoprenoid-binding protein YceI